MDHTYYIYGLVDPRDSSIFYVGQSMNLTARLVAHIAASQPIDKHKKIDELIKNGLRPEMRILETISPDVIFQATMVSEREAYWIRRYHKSVFNKLMLRENRFERSGLSDAE